MSLETPKNAQEIAKMTPTQQPSKRLFLPSPFSPGALALTLALLACFAPAGPLRGHESDPTVERGFNPAQVYHFGDLDAVNAFNGGLSLTVPIGESYRLDGGFSYGLSLSYSSQIWDQVLAVSGTHSNPFLHLRAGDALEVVQAIPNRKSHAGTGWIINLGQLYAPRGGQLNANELNDSEQWVFVDGSGAEHSFFGQLHPDVPPEPSCPSGINCATEYSRDGAYLRLQHRSATEHTVETPGGLTYRFLQATEGGKVVYRLDQVRDPFGNGFLVDYSEPMVWKIIDSVQTSRVQRIEFEASSDWGFDRRIKTIRLESFGDADEAAYTFTYGTVMVKPGCPQDYEPGPAARNLTVLQSISLPDGTNYSFTYATDDTYLDCSQWNGRLASVTLPTSGRIQYGYGGTSFARHDCENTRPNPILGTEPGIFVQVSYGIKRRELIDRDGSSLGLWRYGSKSDDLSIVVPGMVNQCSLPVEHKSVVVEPIEEGRVKKTLTYHSVFIADTAHPDWRLDEYGLPFTRNESIGTGDSELFKSSEIYECDDDGAGSDLFDTSLCDSSEDGGLQPGPRRSTWVRYETSGDDCQGVPGARCTNNNRRMLIQRTVFHDDNKPYEVYSESRNSNFDGLGNFRRHEVLGNFSEQAGDPVKVSFTNFDVGDGYPSNEDPMNRHLRIPDPSAPWILGLHSFRSRSQGAHSSRENLEFDRTTGFLLSRRTLLNPVGSTSANDLRVTFEASPEGNLLEESFYGGDTGNPFSPTQYLRRHSYSQGVLATSEWIDPGNGEVLLRSADHTIDPPTGKVALALDSSGVGNAYDYDDMGRLIGVIPTDSGEAVTAIVYTKATSTSDAQVSVTRGGGLEGTEEEHSYDGLGRLIKSRVLLPDSGWSRVVTSYTPQGQVAWRTTEHSDSGSIGLARVENREFDAFGRPRVVWPASRDLVNGHKIDFTYYGDRETVEKTSQVAVGVGVHDSSIRWTVRDVHGRRTSMTEQAGVAGAGVTTRYEYDQADRLTRVTLPNQPPRLFSYDPRGFLRQESLPELDEDLYYSDFDALGNVGRVRFGSPSEFDREQVYDRVGRLTQIWQEADQRLLKEFFYAPYDTSSIGPDRNSGKLVRAKRHNFIGTQSADAVVTVDYRYEGLGGRLSHQILRTGGNFNVPRVQAETAYDYNALGLVSRIDYPRCGQPGCVGQDPARSVDLTYRRGRLSTVAGFGGLSYHPNGMVSDVLHSNGVSDLIEEDERHLGRPRSISVVGVVGDGWSSGIYRYDGAGNIEAQGDLDFAYDKAYRLTHGEVALGGTIYTQTLSYDDYGNLTTMQRERDGAPQQLFPNPQNNRLPAMGYDVAGNATSFGAFQCRYDAFNRMTEARSPDTLQVFLYDPDDERVGTLIQPDQGVAGSERWTFRGLGKEVLRDINFTFENDEPTWSWKKDYVHRGSSLLASVQPAAAGGEEIRHFHLDHLGTPRLITGPTANRLAEHAYYPYGEEVVSSTDDERLKFTGHERDDLDPNGQTYDLDHMHARMYSPTVGRFLSADPARDGWNLYAYVRGNPMSSTDPAGMATFNIAGQATVADFPLPGATVAVAITVDTEGNLGIAFTGGLALGAEVSAGGEIGVTTHPNIASLNEGSTFTAQVSTGSGGGSVSFDEQGNFQGLTFSPSSTSVGAGGSVALTRTAAIGFNVPRTLQRVSKTLDRVDEKITSTVDRFTNFFLEKIKAIERGMEPKEIPAE